MLYQYFHNPKTRWLYEAVTTKDEKPTGFCPVGFSSFVSSLFPVLFYFYLLYVLLSPKKGGHTAKNFGTGIRRKGNAKKRSALPSCFRFYAVFYLFFLDTGRWGGLFSAPISIARLARPHTNNRIMTRRER